MNEATIQKLKDIMADLERHEDDRELLRLDMIKRLNEAGEEGFEINSLITVLKCRVTDDNPAASNDLGALKYMHALGDLDDHEVAA